MRVGVILIALLVNSSSSFSQHPEPAPIKNEPINNDDTIRIETNLVTLPVSVMDRDGKFITSLSKENFQILEEGIVQDIAVFESVEEPFTVLLLLDVSGSMSAHMDDLLRAANTFVRMLRASDSLIVVTFADQVQTLVDNTRVKYIQKGIKLKQRFREGDTVLYDAVDSALKKAAKINGRKAIVLFSDGVGTGSVSATDTLKRAEESEALLYPVHFGTFSAQPPNYVSKKEYFKRIEEINGYMEGLAVKTGGQYYQISRIADLERTFATVADELGRRYSLGYYPETVSAVGQQRRIKVKVNVPGAVVLARGSYVVGTSNKLR